MAISGNNPSKDKLCAEIRECITRNQAVRESQTIFARLYGLWKSVHRRPKREETMPGGRPRRLSFAGGLTVLLAAIFLFSAFSGSGISEAVQIESVASRSIPADQGRTPAPGAESRTGFVLATSAKLKDLSVVDEISGNETVTAAPHGFMVRVGTFRNPLNAERLADTLEAEGFNVHTEITSNQLHTVTLGQFDEKAEAEVVAQHIQRTMNLVPQVLRVEFSCQSGASMPATFSRYSLSHEDPSSTARPCRP